MCQREVLWEERLQWGDHCPGQGVLGAPAPLHRPSVGTKEPFCLTWWVSLNTAGETRSRCKRHKPAASGEGHSGSFLSPITKRTWFHTLVYEGHQRWTAWSRFYGDTDFGGFHFTLLHTAKGPWFGSCQVSETAAGNGDLMGPCCLLYIKASVLHHSSPAPVCARSPWTRTCCLELVRRWESSRSPSSPGRDSRALRQELVPSHLQLLGVRGWWGDKKKQTTKQ